MQGAGFFGVGVRVQGVGFRAWSFGFRGSPHRGRADSGFRSRCGNHSAKFLPQVSNNIAKGLRFRA